MYDVVVVRRNGTVFRFVHCSRSWSWIDENRKVRKVVGFELEMKIFKPPFFAAFAISSSHRRPTFNLCSNDRFSLRNVCILTRLLLQASSSFSIQKATPENLCYCCTTRQRRRWQKLCPFILSLSLSTSLRKLSNTTHRIHTLTLWWWYNWYISPFL